MEIRVAMMRALAKCIAGCSKTASAIIFVSLSAFTAAADTSDASKNVPKHEVADLRYGVALFYYYQQEYLESISELMVADARDGIQGHADNPELIAGGFSLAFGMQNHAEQLFTHVLQDGRRPQAVRDAAWFYLGKLQYARSDWAGAALSFAKVSENFNKDLLAELHALQINLLIKEKQFSPLSVKNITDQRLAHWESYALYNVGSANAREGNISIAKDFYKALIDSPYRQDAYHSSSYQEYLTLLDKAHTALGYAALQEKNYALAINEFRQVHLDGIESNQALLGYGWASIAQEKYAEALKPWQVLQQRSLLIPAAQEALLALPFAYEKLNAQGDALKEYEKAEQLLGNEVTLIRDMRATLTQGELLTLIGAKPATTEELNALAKKHDPTTLTALITDDGENWLKINNTSVIKTRSMYLRELFAQNEFQASVLDLRDLLKLQKLLKNWQPKLTAYAELIEQKQLWRQQKEQQAAQQSISIKEQQMAMQRDKLHARLETITSAEDYIALADEETRKTYGLVERSDANIARIKQAGEDVSEYEPRLALVRGILLWKAAQTYSQALVENKNTLANIDTSLIEMQATAEKITAITQAGVDVQSKIIAIQHQHIKVQEQLIAVNALIDQRAAQLKVKVDQQLAQHEKRLGRYLAQSHLAVARLYDAALRDAQ